jgi:molecular chaperone GrpE
MTSERSGSNNIPINFFGNDDAAVEEDGVTDPAEAQDDSGHRGPDLAELVASRAEVKRLQTALAEAQDALARRQADFENYRKRIERERQELHNRVVSDLVKKLLPVLDNLTRALDSERSVEASESPEFRHFLHGVELISKQLNDVLDSFGVQTIPAIGERFDPHVHEAVVSEPSDEFEPDTVIEEMSRGYRLGDRLLRPAMVKVASRPAGAGPDNS